MKIVRTQIRFHLGRNSQNGTDEIGRRYRVQIKEQERNLCPELIIKLVLIIGYNVEVVGVEAKPTPMPVDLLLQVGVEDEPLLKLVALQVQSLEEIATEEEEPLRKED